MLQRKRALQLDKGFSTCVVNRLDNYWRACNTSTRIQVIRKVMRRETRGIFSVYEQLIIMIMCVIVNKPTNFETTKCHAH
jgi:hypothetical protein